MNDKYKAEVYEENEKNVYLSITHNGYQWTSIFIKNPKFEIPLIIDVLRKALRENYSVK